jgi:hypothetical protein
VTSRERNDSCIKKNLWTTATNERPARTAIPAGLFCQFFHHGFIIFKAAYIYHPAVDACRKQVLLKGLLGRDPFREHDKIRCQRQDRFKVRLGDRTDRNSTGVKAFKIKGILCDACRLAAGQKPQLCIRPGHRHDSFAGHFSCRFLKLRLSLHIIFFCRFLRTAADRRQCKGKQTDH